MAVESVSLKSYVMRRVLQSIPLLFGVIIVNFLIIHTAPGDPVYIFAGEFELTPEYIAIVRRQWGLDKPLYEQLAVYIGNIIRGDLGYSFFYRQPVATVIMERIPATLLLMIPQLILVSVAGIILGVISSKKPYSVTDNLVTVISLVGYSLPVFLSGLILLLVFSLRLNLFPAQGIISLRAELTGIPYVIDVLHHLVLPSISLGAYYLALITRLMRAKMLEILRLDFITMARAKGLDDNTIYFRHALKNALLPIVTVIGLNTGLIFAGALFTETVFGWPGLGTLMYKSIGARDYPVLMGIFIVVATMVIAINIITDITYGFIDPRVRYK